MKKYMNNYIAEFILYVFVSFLILNTLLEINGRLMSPFLEYTLTFANGLIIVSLVVSTILVVWYNNLINFKYEQSKQLDAMDYYKNTLKILALVVLIAFVYLVNAVLFFDFDWRVLFQYQFNVYVGILFPISVFSQISILIGAYLNRKKNNIIYIFAGLIFNLLIIFSAGFAYYLNNFLVGEFILILTLLNYFLWIYLATKTDFKVSLLLLVIPVAILMITIPIFSEPDPVIVDQMHEFYQSDPVTYQDEINDDYLGEIQVYESNELDIYYFKKDDYNYRYQQYKYGGQSLNVTKDNTIVDYELSYTPQDGYIYGFGIIDKDKEKFEFCNESLLVDTAINSSQCISQEMLETVIYITENQNSLK